MKNTDKSRSDLYAQFCRIWDGCFLSNPTRANKAYDIYSHYQKNADGYCSRHHITLWTVEIPREVYAAPYGEHYNYEDFMHGTDLSR